MEDDFCMRLGSGIACYQVIQEHASHVMGHLDLDLSVLEVENTVTKVKTLMKKVAGKTARGSVQTMIDEHGNEVDAETKAWLFGMYTDGTESAQETMKAQRKERKHRDKSPDKDRTTDQQVWRRFRQQRWTVHRFVSVMVSGCWVLRFEARKREGNRSRDSRNLSKPSCVLTVAWKSECLQEVASVSVLSLFHLGNRKRVAYALFMQYRNIHVE